MRFVIQTLAALFSPASSRSRRSREYCLRMAQLSEDSPFPVGIIGLLGSESIARILAPSSEQERHALEALSHAFFELDRRASYGRRVPRSVASAATSALSVYFDAIQHPQTLEHAGQLVRGYIDECRRPTVDFAV